MRCPVCEETLRAVERHGVEIDVCPSCRGVWLDRGEVDRLLGVGREESRSAADGESRGHAFRPGGRDEGLPGREDRHRSHDEHEHYGESRHGSGAERRRPSSWVGDILGSLGGGDD